MESPEMGQGRFSRFFSVPMESRREPAKTLSLTISQSVCRDTPFHLVTAGYHFRKDGKDALTPGRLEKYFARATSGRSRHLEHRQKTFTRLLLAK